MAVTLCTVFENEKIKSNLKALQEFTMELFVKVAREAREADDLNLGRQCCQRSEANCHSTTSDCGCTCVRFQRRNLCLSLCFSLRKCNAPSSPLTLSSVVILSTETVKFVCC
jgi:hypothetical protein